MYKVLIMTSLALGFALAIGCGNQNSATDGGSTVATTPCTTPGCATPSWATLPGFSPYNYGTGIGFCGCNGGFVPAISGGAVACVSTSVLPPSPVYYLWPSGYSNYGFIGGGPANVSVLPSRNNPYAYQESFNNLYGYPMNTTTTNGCTTSAAIVCNLTQGTTGNPGCSSGRCMPIPNTIGSTTGICTY